MAHQGPAHPQRRGDNKVRRALTTYLGMPPQNVSDYLGIARKGGGGLNACPDGLGQFVWEEFA